MGIFFHKNKYFFEISIDKTILFCYTYQARGGIAQLARAIGSYPIGRGFKSNFRYHIRPVGQAVKTPPFHGGNGGSIPPRVTKKKKHFERSAFSF